jgi:uncharacterized protein with von Willebrand factor type A (vWA) domain
MDLLENTLRFSQALRKRNVGVTIDNVVDAFKGILFIDIEEKKDFYNLLKSNFISHREEAESFDELFEQFWSFEDRRTPSPKKKGHAKMEAEKDEIASFQIDRQRTLLFREWSVEGKEDRQREQKDLPGYSPDEVLGLKDFGLLQKEELEKVKAFVRSLSRKMALTLSRRWKKGKRGDQLDFRGSLRRSLKYGGELLELRRRLPKPKPLRLIFLCDVSGSMDIYSQFFLLFMYGLQNHYPSCETFAFSTRLSPITSLLRRRPFDEALRLLSNQVLDWSGGTNIGRALHQLHQHHGDIYHPSHTIFFIFSDGWDRGDTMLLDSEMKNLRREVKKIVWLNPLSGGRDYQPLCKGMSTALPYLDHFLPCHNLSSLKHLSRLITERFV